MNENGPIWIGADPGGKGNFGIAILTDNGKSHTSCVNYADEAVEFIRRYLEDTPRGVGVDAPLW